ncbi:MAG: hypothetical protein RQ754_03020 [Desulfuromonadales bacterium]|nr:hypothetical protein [Desulfuromonadales bacterium]
MNRRSLKGFWQNCNEEIATVVLLAVLVAAVALMGLTALAPDEMLAITDRLLEAQ